MKNDELTRQFKFEEDLAEGNACLPMAVRFKLDTAGVKVQVQEWVGLPEEERQALLAWPCDSKEDVTRFAERITSLVEAHTGNAPDLFTPLDYPEWRDPESLPEAVRARALELGVTLTSDRWAMLSPLQRFALVKLSRPKHDAAKLRPVLEEFGLAEHDRDPSPPSHRLGAADPE